MTSDRARAVIFDLDGVLVDSEPYWQNAFRDVVNDHLRVAVPVARQFTLQETHVFEGGRVNESLARMLQARGLAAQVGDELVDDLTAAVIRRVTDAVAADPRPITANVEAARRLGRAGVPLAVASSSALPFIDAVLVATGLDRYICVRRSALLLAQGKPHPEVYLQAAAALGIDPAQCLAIEDSATGLAAALRAKIPTVWVRRDLVGDLTGARATAAAILDRVGADPALAQLLVAVAPELSAEILGRLT